VEIAIAATVPNNAATAPAIAQEIARVTVRAIGLAIAPAAAASKNGKRTKIAFATLEPQPQRPANPAASITPPQMSPRN
jgi:hypothetical protein